MIKCLLCNQTLCTVKKVPHSLVLGISEKTSTDDYSKCDAETTEPEIRGFADEKPELGV